MMSGKLDKGTIVNIGLFPMCSQHSAYKNNNSKNKVLDISLYGVYSRAQVLSYICPSK